MMLLKTGSRFLLPSLLLFSLNGCAINDVQQLIDSGKQSLNGLTKKSLTQQDIAAGLKEALSVGASRAVSTVGHKNGYLKNKAIHIALPKKLQKVHKTLNKVGLGKYTRELEQKMNHAAEIAAPKAKKIFLSAIKNMRWQDVQRIYKGKNDAATQYFKIKMTPALKQMMRPVITQTLAQAGVVQAYKHAVKQYHAIPFVPRVKEDITGYVMDKAIYGLFYYLAIEEAAIRKDPLKRTTAILKKVFG